MPGIRENGGQYTHAATWVVLATALLGDGDRALRAVRTCSTRSATPTTPAAVAHYKVEPYVVAADVYGAPPHTGRGGWTWYTGSASWLYRVGLEAILGFRLEGDTLRLEPCIPPSWPGYEITYRHRSATYRVRVENPAGTGRGVRSVTLDGQPVPGGAVPLRDDGQHHEVRVDAGLTADGGRPAMADNATERRRRPVPAADRQGIGPAPADHGAVLPARDQPGQRAGPRQDRPEGPGQHRRRRHGPGDDPGRRRARRHHPGIRGQDHPQAAALPARMPPGPEPDAAGYKGFFYHFLDIETGRRVWQCELSTIDSAFLFAGVLTVATYFDRDTADEAEIRRLADALYRRADWNWACDGGPTLTHGWRPETGFIPHRWQGYDEGLLLYILGLGSPTHPLPPESYRAYCATYQWKTIYGRELLYSGPLFTHQLSHMWIDFRGIRDDFMRERGSDYFENSRQATFVQQEYAIRNPLGFAGYGEHCWGFTACDGPGWVQARGGRRRARVLRLHRARRPVRPRRRHRRPVGRRRLAALRAGDRHPDGPPFRPAGPGDDGQVRVQAVVQPDRSRWTTARPAGGSRRTTSGSTRGRWC